MNKFLDEPPAPAKNKENQLITEESDDDEYLEEDLPKVSEELQPQADREDDQLEEEEEVPKMEENK